MDVDTMRAIDRWAGVPLTFLLTLLQFLPRLLRGRTGKTFPPAQKVLFIELSEMGSTILADPALRKVRHELSAEIYFLIFEKNSPSLELTGTVPRSHILTIRDRNIVVLALDTLKFLWAVRRIKIDTVIDLELFSRFTALLTGLIPAARKIGFYNFCNEGLYRGELLTHRVAYNPHIHIAKNFLALVHPLFSDREELPYAKVAIRDDELSLPRFECTADEKNRILQRVKERAPLYAHDRHHLVLVNPNASELLPQRRWPVQRYEQLISRMLACREDILILITGAPSEFQEAEAMCRRIDHQRCRNFAGAVRLTELPVLYCLSCLLVTNDSGPGHFSAITPIPSFVLFGPETPALYGSLGNSTAIYAGLACSPCVSAANHRKTPCQDNRCLKAITVDQVFQALRPVLDQLPVYRSDAFS